MGHALCAVTEAWNASTHWDSCQAGWPKNPDTTLTHICGIGREMVFLPENTNPLLPTLRQVRASGRMALCGYFLAGYPTPDDFYRMARAARGLDVIEFGIP